MVTLVSLTYLSSRFARWSAASLSRCLARSAARVRQRRTCLALSALDDRALHDIGLDRSMAMSVAIHGPCRSNSQRAENEVARTPDTAGLSTSRLGSPALFLP